MSFKVEVKQWHAVGVWTWEAGDDMCGICRNPFDGCPPDSKFPGDDSPVVWGTCGHAFHLQVRVCVSAARCWGSCGKQRVRVCSVHTQNARV
jgi:hypothetical protein